MVDLTLVMPPAPNLENPLMYYHLGVLYLASVAREAGYSVVIDDLRDKEADYRLITPAKFTGFSATSGQYEMCKQMASKLKNTTTILGGPHSSLLLNGVEGFDVAVAGEGEYIILDILKGLRGKHTTQRITNLDDLPFPAWDLLEPDRCFSRELFPGERYGQGARGATIIGSRGCPYQCNFCGNMLSKPVVYRSSNNITGEIRELIKHFNIHYFRLEDDNITLNKHWIWQLCKELSNLHITFKCHTRTDLVDQASLWALKEAGCQEIGLGIESWDIDVLKLNDKKQTIEQCISAIQMIHQANMRVKIYLIAGLPGETDRTVNLNKYYTKLTHPDKWTLARFTPYPGCAIWKKPEKFGVIHIDRDSYKNFWNFYEHPSYELVGVSKTLLDKRYQELYQWLSTNL